MEALASPVERAVRNRFDSWQDPPTFFWSNKMPRQRCMRQGKPGYKWGGSGFCYTYTPGNKAQQEEAKKKADAQGFAIEGKDFAK